MTLDFCKFKRTVLNISYEDCEYLKKLFNLLIKFETKALKNES